MKILSSIILIISFSILTSFVSEEFTLHKWKIKEWNITYFIDIPIHKVSWIFSNGTSKSMDIIYRDSAVIYAIVDPPGFDTLNRIFSPTELVIRERKLNCFKIDSSSKKTIIADTTIYFGQLSNGRFWKEKCYYRTKICYVNVPKETLNLFEKSISSFRFKRRT
ncbi:MAG: hypothetical protein IPP32_14155 [Bacteroidetes bacterium]|nr:hypothetical protein [Bacteroidota bacterium]